MRGEDLVADRELCGIDAARQGSSQQTQGDAEQNAAGGDEALVSGRVKWFDMVKGYGFVTPDDGGGDVLLHYNLLGQMGRKTLPEGARLTLLTKQGPRGRQAAEILELDLSRAVGEAGSSGERSQNRSDPLDFLDRAGDFEPVQVRWFNRTKGYGFLLRDDGVTQAFVHMETVRRGGFETLQPGQSLRARIHDGARGALAVAVVAEPLQS